jgi:hypothetical protein
MLANAGVKCMVKCTDHRMRDVPPETKTIRLSLMLHEKMGPGAHFLNNPEQERGPCYRGPGLPILYWL